MSNTPSDRLRNCLSAGPGPFEYEALAPVFGRSYNDVKSHYHVGYYTTHLQATNALDKHFDEISKQIGLDDDGLQKYKDEYDYNTQIKRIHSEGP